MKTFLSMAFLLAAACLVAPAQEPAAAWDTCMGCHEELVKAFSATPHAASPAGCVGCHGPVDAHVESGGDPAQIKRLATLSAEERIAACTTCHARGTVAHWMGSAHEKRGLDCASCHAVHPKRAPLPGLLKGAQTDVCGSCHAQQRAKMSRGAHMPVAEGNMTCVSCHNPHGTVTEKALHQHSINDNCYSCHAEKRGPFLYEHEAVREDCVNCHDAHGSIHASMLKVKQPLLCQSCHVFSRHPSTTHMQTSRIAWNKACLNCHSQIHGSNHPAGNYFTR